MQKLKNQTAMRSMMNRAKRPFKALGASLLLAVLVACGGGGGNADNSNDTADSGQLQLSDAVQLVPQSAMTGLLRVDSTAATGTETASVKTLVFSTLPQDFAKLSVGDMVFVEPSAQFPFGLPAKILEKPGNSTQQLGLVSAVSDNTGSSCSFAGATTEACVKLEPVRQDNFLDYFTNVDLKYTLDPKQGGFVAAGTLGDTNISAQLNKGCSGTQVGAINLPTIDQIKNFITSGSFCNGSIGLTLGKLSSDQMTDMSGEAFNNPDNWMPLVLDDQKKIHVGVTGKMMLEDFTVTGSLKVSNGVVLNANSKVSGTLKRNIFLHAYGTGGANLTEFLRGPTVKDKNYGQQNFTAAGQEFGVQGIPVARSMIIPGGVVFKALSQTFKVTFGKTGTAQSIVSVPLGVAMTVGLDSEMEVTVQGYSGMIWPDVKIANTGVSYERGNGASTSLNLFDTNNNKLDSMPESRKVFNVQGNIALTNLAGLNLGVIVGGIIPAQISVEGGLKYHVEGAASYDSNRPEGEKLCAQAIVSSQSMARLVGDFGAGLRISRTGASEPWVDKSYFYRNIIASNYNPLDKEQGEMSADAMTTIVTDRWGQFVDDKEWAIENDSCPYSMGGVLVQGVTPVYDTNIASTLPFLSGYKVQFGTGKGIGSFHASRPGAALTPGIRYDAANSSSLSEPLGIDAGVPEHLYPATSKSYQVEASVSESDPLLLNANGGPFEKRVARSRLNLQVGGTLFKPDGTQQVMVSFAASPPQRRQMHPDHAHSHHQPGGR